MNPSEKHTLEIDSVELSFGDRRILSGVYLAVETGGVSAVLGRNGCGKSCLMKSRSTSFSWSPKGKQPRSKIARILSAL